MLLQKLRQKSNSKTTQRNIRNPNRNNQTSKTSKLKNTRNTHSLRKQKERKIKVKSNRNSGFFQIHSKNPVGTTSQKRTLIMHFARFYFSRFFLTNTANSIDTRRGLLSNHVNKRLNRSHRNHHVNIFYTHRNKTPTKLIANTTTQNIQKARLPECTR